MAWQGIRRVMTDWPIRTRRIIRFFWFTMGILLNIVFFLLFSFSPDPDSQFWYTFYFWFNALFLSDIVCKIPLAIASLLAPLLHDMRKRHVVATMGIIISFGLMSTLLWAFFPGTRMVEKREVTVSLPGLPAAFEGYTIIHISDAHLGSFNQRNVLEKMAAIAQENHPDLILFTGDMVNNYAWETENWIDIFRSFNATCGKFAILGNHDYGDYSEWPSPVEKAENFLAIEKSLNEMGFTLLRNQHAVLKRANDSIFLVGVDNWGHPPFPQYADLKQAEAGIPDNTFRILLSHDPAHWTSTIRLNAKYPLTLSGHTHGLQWGIKAAGISLSLIWLLDRHWGGLYSHEGRYLYVNRGFGNIGMPFRIDMPAEITILKLTAN